MGFSFNNRCKCLLCSLFHQDCFLRVVAHSSTSMVNKYFGPSILDTSQSKNIHSCTICLLAKQTWDIFPLSLNNAFASFDIIHCEQWGLYHTVSTCGVYYFLTILDDYSRSIWLLKNMKLRAFKWIFWLWQFNKTAEVVHSNNGAEFVCLESHFLEHKILCQTTIAGTP